MSTTAWIARTGYWVYGDSVEKPVDIVALTHDWWHALTIADGLLEAGEEPLPLGADGHLYYVRFQHAGQPLHPFWPDSPGYRSMQEAVEYARLKTPHGVVRWELASVVELELWLPPGRLEAPMDGKLLAERCLQETCLSHKFVIGLNFVPDESDIQRLEQGIAGGRFSHQSFTAFCQRRSLLPHPINAKAAAEFLAFEEGQPLAWLHLPAGPHGLAFAQALVCWAGANHLQIRDGASKGEALSTEQIRDLWSCKSQHP